jgi:hypothetical protein
MVGIKDLKMPSCCMNCELTYHDEAMNRRCSKTKHVVEFNFNERADNCPLVEIEERKVGKWVYKKLGVRTFGIVCSNCNRTCYEEQNVGSLEEFKRDIERIMRERNVTLDKYCCHCGTEM